MLVQELIERLESAPQDAVIFLDGEVLSENMVVVSEDAVEISCYFDHD